MSVPRSCAALVALLFLLQGWPFLKGLGIEVDEALIGGAIYPGGQTLYSWRMGEYEIPLMLLSYMGTLKAWLYNAIFAVFRPGAVSLRLPMMLAGAITLWLFFRLLDQVAGRPAAWMGALLLATDTSFLLTESVDLGAVAIQHLLKLGAILLALRFHRTGSTLWLAAAFFLLGLAVWDKAVFLWALAGLGIATLIAFPREVRASLRPKRIAIASAAFALGAAPFLAFNIQYPMETLRANANLGANLPSVKGHLLRESLNGHGLFNFLTAPDPGPKPAPARRWPGRLSLELDALFHAPRTNWIVPALALSVLVLPFVWQQAPRRFLLFAGVFMAVTWIQMLLTSGAGIAVHHVILLWPFPLAVIAVILSALAAKLGRFRVVMFGLTLVLLCGRNLLVTNWYYGDLVRNGSSVRWTDAFTPLMRYLQNTDNPSIVMADWGIFETVLLLSEGEAPAENACFAVRDSSAPESREWLMDRISSEKILWIGHAAGLDQFPGNTAKLDELARTRGFRRELVTTIQDRNGRAIFELFRFRNAS